MQSGRDLRVEEESSSFQAVRLVGLVCSNDRKAVLPHCLTSQSCTLECRNSVGRGGVDLELNLPSLYSLPGEPEVLSIPRVFCLSTITSPDLRAVLSVTPLDLALSQYDYNAVIKMAQGQSSPRVATLGC